MLGYGAIVMNKPAFVNLVRSNILHVVLLIARLAAAGCKILYLNYTRVQHVVPFERKRIFSGFYEVLRYIFNDELR
jgi:hypothetical protein